jgi:hypothetical protein
MTGPYANAQTARFANGCAVYAPLQFITGNNAMATSGGDRNRLPGVPNSAAAEALGLAVPVAANYLGPAVG